MKLIRAQLEKTLSAKLDEMLSLQKSTFDRIGLGYGLPSSNIASTSITVFVPPANNVEIENNDIKTDLASKNLDKGKSILGAPPKQDKNEAKNPRAKKANSQEPKQKKQHLWFKGLIKGKVLPGCGRKRAPSDSITFLFSLVFVCALLVCFAFNF